MSEPVLRWSTTYLVGERRAAALAMLTPAEVSRLEFDRHPERFLAGRMLLRELARDLTGLPLASVTVTATCPDCGREHGQPRVDGLFMSLSRAADATVAAASATAPVGVDIEAREVSSDQLAAIRVVAGGDGLVHWTRIEAVLKADGRGLRVDPPAIGIESDVATLDGASYRLIEIGDRDYVGTVAVRL